MRKQSAAILLASFTIVSVAAAQEAVIGEVVVTARKREENLQDTPLAVSAFSGVELEQKGVTKISEAVLAAPNVVFDGPAPVSGNNAAPSVFIRGVGQIDFTVNNDPGVGIYVDGVYLGRSVGSLLELVDIERVEVLRGPQGTLFGRNSIGGAINLISKAPAQNFGGFVAAGVGTGDRREVQAAIDLPVGDRLLTKWTVASRQQDGNVRNLQNGQDLGDTNALIGRFQARWLANDALTVDLGADYTRQHENGPGNVPLRLFGNAIPGRIDTGTSASNFGARTNFAPFGAAFLQGCTPAIMDTSLSCFGQAWLPNDAKYATQSGYRSVSDNDIWGASLTVNYDFGEVALKSISAYRELDSAFQRDSDHTPFQVFQTRNQQRQEQVSQEFNLSGSGSSLGYVLGAYYFREQAEEPLTTAQPGADGRLLQADFRNFVENDNWAVFSELVWDLTDTLQLSAGGRYTDETKSYRSVQRFLLLSDPSVEVLRLINEPGASADYREFTKRISLRYKPIEVLSLYATYADGFKSGGFNPRYLAPTPGLRAIPFAPEYLDSYEVGAKFISPDRTVRANLAVFHNLYEDIQVNINSPLAGGAKITSNAAEATIDGVEVELTFLLTNNFSVNAAVGYLDAAYERIDAQDPLISVNNRLARIPEWSTNLGTAYTLWLPGSLGSLTGRLDWTHRSDAAGDATNAPEIEMPGYDLLNATLTYETSAGNWSAALGLSNLTNETYLISTNANARLGYAEGIYGREREWTLRVKYGF